jgi:hypothetical protein
MAKVDIYDFCLNITYNNLCYKKEFVSGKSIQREGERGYFRED